MSGMGPAGRPRSSHSRDGTPSWFGRAWLALPSGPSALSARPATLTSTDLRPIALPPAALPGDRHLDGVRSPPRALGATGVRDLGGVLVLLLALRRLGAALLGGLRAADDDLRARVLPDLLGRLGELRAARRDEPRLRVGAAALPLDRLLRLDARAWEGERTVRFESSLSALWLACPRLL